MTVNSHPHKVDMVESGCSASGMALSAKGSEGAIATSGILVHVVDSDNTRHRYMRGFCMQNTTLRVVFLEGACLRTALYRSDEVSVSYSRAQWRIHLPDMTAWPQLRGTRSAQYTGQLPCARECGALFMRLRLDEKLLTPFFAV